MFGPIADRHGARGATGRRRRNQRFGVQVPALFARATIVAVPTVQAEPEERDP
jgi:hypothetical protein